MHRSLGLLAFMALPTAFAQEPPTLIDPRTRFDNLTIELPAAQIPPVFPALQGDFPSPPDCGEETYIGEGRLQGRKALITGGDSGIGRAVAIAFAKEGAEVAINYLPEEEADAQDLADYFETRLEKTLHRIPGDLLDEEFCAELPEQANEALGGLDVLVNNAGYGGYQAGGINILNQTTEEFDRIFRTNVYAGFFVTRAAVPLMPPGSNIIFTASMTANLPNSRSTSYAASKAAVVNFAQGLAGQMVRFGIRVNAVLPALVYSSFLVTIGFSMEALEQTLAGIPLGRLLQPVELAPLYVNFADPQNSYASGSWVDTPGGSVQ